MRLVEATVLSNKDPDQMGTLLVTASSISTAAFSVTFTTPYHMGHEGGFFAVPNPGTRILICQAENSKKWFFSSCIVEYPRKGTSSEDKGIDPLAKQRAERPAKDKKAFKIDPFIPVRDGERAYAVSGIPAVISWKDPLDNTFSLNHRYSPTFMDIKASMESSLGKKIQAIDSPKLDRVLIKNEHGDFWLLSTDANPRIGIANRSRKLKTQGPQWSTCTESEIINHIVDGQDYTVYNESPGGNKPHCSIDHAHNHCQKQRWGNINLQSEFRDINLYMVRGKLFINVPDSSGLVQIASGDQVNIFSEGNVNVSSGGSIAMRAEKDLFMNAGRHIHINSASGHVIVGAGEKASKEVLSKGHAGTIALAANNRQILYSKGRFDLAPPRNFWWPWSAGDARKSNTHGMSPKRKNNYGV